ncbi:MAG TPA: cytochrome c oxidase subunit II [Candidatus Limnocylindrales bacterium]|nr:cytochrome c oxidase subunit II [Candidatus Limnocylindrales bacterium]
MRSRKRNRGSAAVAGLLSLLLVILVGVTVYIFAAGIWVPPPAITSVGHDVDHQYNLTLALTGAVFILSQLGLAYAIWRFRDRGQKAHYTHGNNTMEVIWTSATIILFVGLGLLGYRAWAEVRFTQPSPDAIKVEVTENQFVFNFRYAGPDGKFGRLDPKLISASTGNPLGLDPDDPTGKDDIVVPTLTVPVNHEIELLIRSQDVIHNFYVRELRLQQDAVPGLMIPMHFTADTIGRYEIVCTQLCGLAHYRMRSFLDVVSDADYQNFLKQQEQALTAQ